MRNVIVTGASRGLGLAISKRLVASGFRVIGIARRESDDFKKAAAAAPDVLVFSPYDLGDIDGMPELLKVIRKAHGPIYGLVNNAGLGTEGLISAMPM